MRLRPSPSTPVAPPRGVVHSPEAARFIRCDVCGKWRRVDADTLQANSSLIWNLDDLHSVREQIKMENPQVLAVLLN